MTAGNATAVEHGPPPERGARVCVESGEREGWSSVVEAKDADLIILTVEPGAGPSADITPGRAVLLTYSARQVPCEADATVVDDPEWRAPGRVCVRLSEPPRRNQRRGAVRVPMDLIVRAREADERTDEPDALTFAAVTENLSAGGALLRATEAIAIGTDLLIHLQPGPEGPVMELASRVVRCDRDGATSRPWRIAVAFRGVSRAQEDHMMRFLFRIQREARRRESGMSR